MKKGKVIISAFLFLLFSAIFLFFPTKKDIENAHSFPQGKLQVISRLQALSMAFIEYEKKNGVPIKNITKKENPLLSWRVGILPFVGESDLFHQFRLDEKWDSRENRKLINKIPNIFQHPRQGREGCTGFVGIINKKSNIFGLIHKEHPFPIIVECTSAIIWTQPKDFIIDDLQLPDSAWGGRYFILNSNGSVVLSEISDLFKSGR